jgi:hypothetical protein
MKRLVLTILIFGAPLIAGVPPRIIDTPGGRLGEVSTRWLAPFVHETDLYWGEGCDAVESRTVRWYDRVGNPTRELVGVRSSSYGCVEDQDGTLYGTCLDWTIRHEPSRCDYLSTTVTENSRFLVRTCAIENTFELELYDTGLLVTTLGPFTRGMGNPELYLDEDGHLALVDHSGAKGRVSLLVFDVGKGPLLEVPLEEPFRVLGCNSSGLLVGKFDEREPIRYFSKGGAHSNFVIPGHRFLGWAASDDVALFSYPAGGEKLILVSCRAGQTLWERDFSSARRVTGSWRVAFVDSLVIAASIEVDPMRFQDRRPSEPYHQLRALSLSDGSTVAVWHTNTREPFFSYEARFVYVRGRLYWVTGNDFCEIEVNDIVHGKYGWTAPN